MEMERTTLYDSQAYKLDALKTEANEYDALLGVKRKIPYPKSVFFIIVTEFCERFSFYGMRAVLTIYLRNALRFSDDTATILYHAFVMLAYLTPLFGGILADSYLGKFRTIFYLSIVYAIGNITLSSAAVPTLNLPAVPISLLGLCLIALGTGGIKPSVSSFGGDQFHIPGQEKQLSQFFFVFYFAINSGSLISTFVTPILRKDVGCFGQETCYALAFGVPAGLMILALAVFLLGKPFYKIKEPKGNVFVQVVGCISHAITTPVKKKTRFHWLDYANDKYDKEFIEDVKQLLQILLLFIPLPIFWSLFEQQGSRWTLQATRMNGSLWGGMTLKPDQMVVANSLLVLLFIPLFESLIYPVLAKCSVLKKPLQRMTIGGLLAALSFVVAGVIELNLEPTYAQAPGTSATRLNFVNTVPCPLNVSLEPLNGPFPDSWPSIRPSQPIRPFDNFVFTSLPAINYLVQIEPGTECGGTLNATSTTIRTDSEKAYSVLITKSQAGKLGLLWPPEADDLAKSEDGYSKLKFVGNSGIFYTGLGRTNSTLVLEPTGETKSHEFTLAGLNGGTGTEQISPGTYAVVLEDTVSDESLPANLGTVLLETGGSYLVTLFRNDVDYTEMRLYVLTVPNSVHMLLQLPQYVIMTLAEILFSITGYSFSYTQAPNSMKSVIQSVWLLTNAIGSLIVIIVTEADVFQRQAVQFFIFSGLMFLATFLFIYLAANYKPVDTQPSSPLFKRKKDLPPMDDFMMADTKSDTD